MSDSVFNWLSSSKHTDHRPTTFLVECQRLPEARISPLVICLRYYAIYALNYYNLIITITIYSQDSGLEFHSCTKSKPKTGEGIEDDFIEEVPCPDKEASAICCDLSSSFGVYSFFKTVYIPFLLSKFVRPLVIVAFLLLLSSSLVVIPSIEIGLDKELTVTETSYVYKYFQVSYVFDNQFRFNFYGLRTF